MISRNSHFKALLIGLISGVGGGLASLGGGTLIIPLLIGWLGLVPVAARGTAIAVSIFSSGLGAFIYYQGHMLDLSVAMWVAIPSFLLTPMAAKWSENWSADRLEGIFGIVVIIGGFLVLFRDEVNTGMVVPVAWDIPYLILVGSIEGLIAGIVGVSGGPILAPLFVLGLGMPQQLAQGCSLAARLPAVLSGSLENWRLGNIQWTLIPAMVSGCLPGAWLGSSVALILPEQWLRTIFAFLLIIIGGKYIKQTRKKWTAN